MDAAHVYRAGLAIAGISTGILALYTNAIFWIDVTRHDRDLAALAVATSLSAGVFKLCIPAYCVAAGIQLFKNKGLLILFCVALTYDVCSGLGYAAKIKSANNAETVAALNAYKSAEQQLLDALRTRDTISAPRKSVGRIEAEISAGVARAGNCTVRAHTDACRTLAELRGELADAQAHAAASARVDVARLAVAAAPAPGRAADPQADATIAALALVGVRLTPAHAAALWGLLLLLLYELGPTVGLATAAAPRGAAAIPLATSAVAPVAPAAPLPQQSSDVLDILRGIVAGSHQVEGCYATATDVIVSQRQLAYAAGTTPPTIKRRLQNAGIRLVTNGGVSVVKIQQLNEAARTRLL